MSSARPFWAHPICGWMAPLVVSLIALAANGGAQSTDAVTASTSPAQPAVPTLQTLDQSTRTQDFTTVQLRRFRDSQGNVVSVRERLEVDSNGSLDPNFDVTFLGVEGEPAGSPTTLKWQ